MTVKEFLIHMWDWLKQCPLFIGKEWIHTFSGTCGDPKMECIVCHRTYMDNEEDMLADEEAFEEYKKIMK